MLFRHELTPDQAKIFKNPQRKGQAMTWAMVRRVVIGFEEGDAGIWVRREAEMKEFIESFLIPKIPRASTGKRVGRPPKKKPADSQPQ